MSKKENGKKFTTTHVVIAMAVVIVLLGGLVLSRYIKDQKEAAYLQGLEEANVTTEKIKVNDEITIETATLEEMIAPASKLTTYEYYYTEVGKYEKSNKLFDKIKVPFTTDEAVYVYKGRIGAGIILDDIIFDVNNAKKTITIKYPSINIIFHEMDEGFESYNIKKATFNRSDFSDFEDFRKDVKEKVEKDLMNDETFFASAREHTELVISSILTASGKINDYTITHKWS